MPQPLPRRRPCPQPWLWQQTTGACTQQQKARRDIPRIRHHCPRGSRTPAARPSGAADSSCHRCRHTRSRCGPGADKIYHGQRRTPAPYTCRRPRRDQRQSAPIPLVHARRCVPGIRKPQEYPSAAACALNDMPGNTMRHVAHGFRWPTGPPGKRMQVWTLRVLHRHGNRRPILSSFSWDQIKRLAAQISPPPTNSACSARQTDTCLRTFITQESNAPMNAPIPLMTPHIGRSGN